MTDSSAKQGIVAKYGRDRMRSLDVFGETSQVHSSTSPTYFWLQLDNRYLT